MNHCRSNPPSAFRTIAGAFSTSPVPKLGSHQQPKLLPLVVASSLRFDRVGRVTPCAPLASPFAEQGRGGVRAWLAHSAPPARPEVEPQARRCTASLRFPPPMSGPIPAPYPTVPNSYCTVPACYPVVPEHYSRVLEYYFPVPNPYPTVPELYFSVPELYPNVPAAYFSIPEPSL